MKRSILASSLILIGLSLSAMGCSRAATICGIICDCEHCNDQKEIQACDQYGTIEDVASAYSCDDKWNAYMDCVEQRGVCDAKESRFSTRNTAGDDLCQSESDALDSCIKSASAHDGTNVN
jgi:hypothetical protein